MYNHISTRMPVGMIYSTIEYLYIDLSTIGLITISGKDKSGKTNFVNYLIQVFLDLQQPLETFIIDAELEIRQQDSLRNKHVENFSMQNYPLILLIIEHRDLINYLNLKKDIQKKLLDIFKLGKNYNMCTIISNFENKAIALSAGDLLRCIKDTKNFIIFENISEIKLFDKTMKMQKEYPKPLNPGEAYITLTGNFEKIKTIFNN